MKFGKNLPRNQVPEWSSFYIDYKGLKKLIRVAVHSKQSGAVVDLAPFLFALDRSIEIVDSFFNKRLADAQRRLKLLRGRYEDNFDLSPSSENSSVNGSTNSDDWDSDRWSKIRGGRALDRNEIEEILGALLELRSKLRKIQWYGEVNRRGFIKILKKIDKKTGSSVQRQYLDSKVMPMPFASAGEAFSTLKIVNLWLPKVSGTEGKISSIEELDSNQGRASENVRFPLRRTPSSAASGISTEVVDQLDQCIGEDNATRLIQIIQSSEGVMTQKLLLSLLQSAIPNRSLKCIEALLGRVESLNECDDINDRNIIHRLVISTGRTKGLLTSSQKDTTTAASRLAVPSQLFITPAESPIGTPPPANTLECDSTPNLSADDESVRLLDFILKTLPVSHRSALAARDSYGRLALHYAAQYGFVVLCQLIIRYMREWNQFDVSDGIDSAIWQDCDGYAPLHLAVIREHTMTARALLQAENCDQGVGISGKVVLARKTVSKSSAVLILAFKRNCVAIVRFLVEAGVDINYQDENGETALHHGARLGHVLCVSALLSGNGGQRPDVELTEKTYGWTPLFVAAVEGKIEVAEALIGVGRCEIDKVDFSGWTAPEHAALRGHLELCKMLIHSCPTKGSDNSAVTPIALLSGFSQEKNISAASLSGPTGFAVPTTMQPQAVKCFGHRYLKKDETMVLITLGSMDTRKNIQAVKLDQIPVSEAHTTQLDTALSLVVSGQHVVGDPVTIDLPAHANVSADDPILFKTNDASKVKLIFDIVPTYAGSNDRIIGRAVALLNAIKPEVGKQRVSLEGGIQVPIMAVNTLEVIGCVNFEFNIVTPFDHPNISITKEHTYWKSLTTPRVIGHRGDWRDGVPSCEALFYLTIEKVSGRISLRENLCSLVKTRCYHLSLLRS